MKEIKEVLQEVKSEELFGEFSINDEEKKEERYIHGNRSYEDEKSVQEILECSFRLN